MREGNYRVEYISCICPKCKKEITLKFYSKVPILSVELANLYGEEEEMTNHQDVERAKKEARRNLTGEDLEKCIKALEAWERNTQTE